MPAMLNRTSAISKARPGLPWPYRPAPRRRRRPKRPKPQKTRFRHYELGVQIPFGDQFRQVLDDMCLRGDRIGRNHVGAAKRHRPRDRLTAFKCFKHRRSSSMLLFQPVRAALSIRRRFLSRMSPVNRPRSAFPRRRVGTVPSASEARQARPCSGSGARFPSSRVRWREDKRRGTRTDP